MLFVDPRLSRAENTSCASCHNPSFDWESPVARPVGDANTPLGRNSPSTLDHAWVQRLFWDGRARALVEQVAGAITADVEINLSMAAVVERIGRVPEYRDLFDRAVPGEGVTPANVTRAIATVERTLVSTRSPFDRWVEDDGSAISEAAQPGLQPFVGKARCASCHSVWAMTDHAFRQIGLPDEDIGRGTHAPDDVTMQHAFKTPSLRDTARRAPNMHDGSLADLPAVLAHDVIGGVPRTSLSPTMRPLDLSREELGDIAAFLATLTGEVDVVALPTLPN